MFQVYKNQLISHRNITLLNVSHNLQKHVCDVVRIFAKIQTMERGIILLQGQYKTKRREWKWIWNEEETFNKRWYIQYMGNKDSYNCCMYVIQLFFSHSNTLLLNIYIQSRWSKESHLMTCELFVLKCHAIYIPTWIMSNKQKYVFVFKRYI